ncbi:MAG: SLBB domain-containing protein [Vulcanimicrobiota bacterium]
MSFRLTISLLLLALVRVGWTDPMDRPLVPETASPRSLEAGTSGAPGRQLRVGDELEIQIFALPEIEKKYVVRVDGNFYHPVAGEIEAAGKTLPQVQAAIAKRLAAELRNPGFRLGLLGYAKSEIAVLGEVKSQGRFPIVPGSTIFDVVAMAGGLSEKADPRDAILMRGETQIPVDLLPSSGQQSLEIRDGDILYVYAGKRISVAGEVQKAGVFAVSRNSANPVAEAIKAAGGPKETAALRRVMLVRPTLPRPLIVDILPDDQGQISDVARNLEDGDTLVVPPLQAVLLGAVGKQGPVDLKGGETLLDIVSAAGVNKEGELDKITVVRAKDVAAGNNTKEQYNLKEFFENKDKVIEPVPINDGDLVYIPAKADSNGGLLGGSNILQLILLARNFLF